MHNDPTIRNSAPLYPYDNYSPYPDVPYAPPPKKRYNTGKIAPIIMSSFLSLVTIGAVGLVSYIVGKDNAVSISPSPVVIYRNALTPVVTPSPLSSSYTVNDIIRDFTSNNLPVSDVTTQSLNKFLDGMYWPL